MSEEEAALPNVGNGLLRASRTKSYGSLVRSPLSPVRQRRIEHKLQPGETLQGLALKYGVSMEQIKRANRMYTNDSIFQKKSLSIPVLADLDHRKSGADLPLENSEEDIAGCDSAEKGCTGTSSEKKQDDGRGSVSDLSPVDFLKRLDGLINQSKQAAVQGCQEAEKRVAALEEACASRTSDWRPLTRSQSAITSPAMQQLAQHGAVPLTITKLTRKLRDREDELFQL